MTITYKVVPIVDYSDLKLAYQTRYKEKFDLDDLFGGNWVNGCYKIFDLQEILHPEDEDFPEEYDEDSTSYKTAQLLADEGVNERSWVFIHIWW